MADGSPGAEQVALLEEREGMPPCPVAGCRVELLFDRSFALPVAPAVRDLERRDSGPADTVQTRQLVDEVVGRLETTRRSHVHAVILPQSRRGTTDRVRKRGDNRSPNDRIDRVRRIFETLV